MSTKEEGTKIKKLCCAKRISGCRTGGIVHVVYIPDIMFRDIVSNSTAYIALVRCGQNPDDVFLKEDFQEITNFNTLQTASYLGAAASSLSEMILREAAKAAAIASRSLAKKDEKLYNNNERNTEGMVFNGWTDIQQKRGWGSLSQRLCKRPLPSFL